MSEFGQDSLPGTLGWCFSPLGALTRGTHTAACKGSAKGSADRQITRNPLCSNGSDRRAGFEPKVGSQAVQRLALAGLPSKKLTDGSQARWDSYAKNGNPRSKF